MYDTVYLTTRQKKTARNTVQYLTTRQKKTARNTVSYINKRKLRYAGHIMRDSSGPLLQLHLAGKIEEKRGQGRPRRKWMDDVKEWSGSTSYGDTKRKADNRVEWRDMVANLRTEDAT
ncbi:endonuclease-reverse transcriptase [Elysia marginata]|uniref:Endonuclease-reverse transcriptase n=1 Tax=Elysia marginata TaxID=1093978 RepID=A0AAV4ENT7_9GAST|nr:endonuclease-reverse transcriptase [Elysia marginata]